MAADDPNSEAPPKKRHTPFTQVMFRKIGEAVDLGGKAMVGVSGFESLIKTHRPEDVDWERLLTGLALGSAAVVFGIYLLSSGQGRGDLTMSDSVFAFILSLGGLCALMGLGALWIVPRMEARERRRARVPHPAE